MPTHNIYSVIIADDDPDEIELLKTCFDSNDSFSIMTTVENGQQLVDYIIQNNVHPDIIVTDMFMPIMNGVEAVLKLQELEILNTTLVALFSTSINKSAEEKLVNLPNVVFYNKPANYNEYLILPEKLSQSLKNL